MKLFFEERNNYYTVTALIFGLEIGLQKLVALCSTLPGIASTSSLSLQ